MRPLAEILDAGAEQPSLFPPYPNTPLPSKPRFDGPAYVPENDDARLTGQLKRIWEYMAGGKWRTLGEIAAKTGAPESSVSAQLRHLRKPRFGSHKVLRRHLNGEKSGLYEYRIVPNWASKVQP